MNLSRFFRPAQWFSLSATALMAACTATVPPANQQSVSQADTAPVHPECTPAASGSQTVGNWLSKHKQKGVAGEVRVLFTLHTDGRMAYTEQVKRANKPSQGLNENGCWTQQANQLILSTQESNGVLTEPGDPIYQNAYQIISQSADKLQLRSEEGTVYVLTRMSPGYRLPF